MIMRFANLWHLQHNWKILAISPCVCVHARASVRVCVCARVPPCLPASLLRTCPLRHLVPSVLYRSFARTLWPPISRTQSLSSLLSRHANDTLSDSGTNSQQMTASSFSKIRHLSNCARVRASTHVRHRELCVFARGCSCARAHTRPCGPLSSSVCAPTCVGCWWPRGEGRER